MDSPFAPTGMRALALQALCIAEPQHKVQAVMQLQQKSCEAASEHALETDAGSTAAPRMPTDLPLPGRPARPKLVHPARVPRRSPHSPQGLAALLHAIAHIEFNAINLALDAVWRFDGMPEAYYRDWLRVASEEALHFSLLREHLQTLGHDYGDFDAHDNLWQMCERTAGDIVARMALVPRTLEARGLDATPQIQHKLRSVGTPQALRAVDILDVILRDEVGHGAIGNHWDRWLCEREGLDPVAHYATLVERHAAPRLHPPFNAAARKRAGFTDAELAWLSS
ncbi:MAG: ferritin-like domain-containing protein [Burkholderiaceae bacterium]